MKVRTLKYGSGSCRNEDGVKAPQMNTQVEMDGIGHCQKGHDTGISRQVTGSVYSCSIHFSSV